MAAERDGSPTLNDAYAVDVARPLDGWEGAAFPATAKAAPGAPLLAIVVPPGRAPRARILAEQTGTALPGVLMPLAHGPLVLPDGRTVWAVVTDAPPGPSLAAVPRAWTENELLRHVVIPVGAALARLHASGVHHRGIRPDNLFAAAGQPCVLGPAWTEPPASRQPAVCEPPYSAMCLPCGRGEGAAGDDIYALGVTLIALVAGRLPLAGLDDAAVIRRKLDLGSFAALTGDLRLSPSIADLLRGMLADDPEHRPAAALLADPAALRARRAYVRPPRRAARALLVGAESVADGRSLAWAMARDPATAVRHLRSGVIEHWLRRELGDAPLAQAVEDALRQRRATATSPARADGLLLARAIAALDPLAPLCWDGLAWWPDATGSALAAAAPGDAARIVQAVAAEAPAAWAGARPERSDVHAIAAEARRQRALLATAPPAGGTDRLLYALCPLLPCAAPLLAGRAVARLADILPALEAAAADPARHRAPPLDTALTAFIAARSDQQGDGLAPLIERALAADRPPAPGDAAEADPARGALPPLAQLRLLAALQTRTRPGRLPLLAAWFLVQAAPVIATWQNTAARAAVQSRLTALAAEGVLAPMLAVLDDPAALAADAQGAQAARRQVAAIDAALRGLAAAGAARAEAALRLGQELAVGAGMMALATALARLALG